LFVITVDGDHQMQKRISLLTDQQVSSSLEVVWTLVCQLTKVLALPKILLFPQEPQHLLLWQLMTRVSDSVAARQQSGQLVKVEVDVTVAQEMTQQMWLAYV